MLFRSTHTVALLAGVALIAYFVGARNVHRLLTDSLQLSFENVALRREAEEKSALLEAWASSALLRSRLHLGRQPVEMRDYLVDMHHVAIFVV